MLISSPIRRILQSQRSTPLPSFALGQRPCSSLLFPLLFAVGRRPSFFLVLSLDHHRTQAPAAALKAMCFVLALCDVTLALIWGKRLLPQPTPPGDTVLSTNKVLNALSARLLRVRIHFL